MPTTIEKTFRFDAGHRQLGFEPGKEELLHGHRFDVRVVIETTSPLDGYKTIFDTNVLKPIVQPLIDELDHSYLLWDEDPMACELVDLCKKFGIADKILVKGFNPTLEGIVEYLYHAVKAKLALENAILKRVDVRATATLYASYYE